MNQLWDPVTTGQYAGVDAGIPMVFQCNVYYLTVDGQEGTVGGQGTLQNLRGSDTQFRLQIDGEGDTVFRLQFPCGANCLWDVHKTKPVVTRNGKNGKQRALINIVTFDGSKSYKMLQVSLPLVSSNVKLAKLFRAALVHMDQRIAEIVRPNPILN